MPIPFLIEAAFVGIPWLPSFWSIGKVLTLLAFIVVVKWYTRGAVNSSERNMHSKVVMITVTWSRPHFYYQS